MKMNFPPKFTFFTLLSLNVYLIVCGEVYNLFGIPGQGYLVEVRLGQPSQQLNVLVDTGSSTLAVATVPGAQVSTYFHSENSTSLYNSGKEVSAKYSQGGWCGKVASDYVQFPTVDGATIVRSDIVLITLDYSFFMNGSGWQGILGLAYEAIAVGSAEVTAQTWLHALSAARGTPFSFQLTLCGVRSITNATHYGRFALLDDKTSKSDNAVYKTPILRERWYEIGVLGVRWLTTAAQNSSVLYGDITSNLSSRKSTYHEEMAYTLMEDTCQLLNAKKSILDSGTTNIRLPAPIFREIVNELRNAALAANLMILDDTFWYNGEADCWPEPQHWSLPRLAIDLLDADNDHQYFTLEIPPQNYIRLMSARYSTGTVAEFCYELGLEPDSSDTVLGVAAMEGFEVVFNRSSRYISFRPSECGPDVRITGPYRLNSSITKLCKLEEPDTTVVGGIKSAQWAAAIALMIAMALLLYLLAPCLRNKFVRSFRRRPSQISLSRATLVGQEA